MSTRKLLTVARREYLETVKTKAFLLGILLMPGIIIGMIFLSTRMAVSHEMRPVTLRVAIVDAGGRVATEMARHAASSSGGRQVVELEVVPPESAGGPSIDQLKARVCDRSLAGAIEVPAEAGDLQARFRLYTCETGMDDRLRTTRSLLREAVKSVRFAEAGFDVARLEELSGPVEIAESNLRGEKQGGREDRVAGMMTPFAFVFLLFMGIFGVSQGLLTSVIEEKSSRVVEVLLSALSPFELMAGKIIGMAGVGLTMVLLWAGVGYGAAVARDMQHVAQLTCVGQFVLYYVLGFMLISSMLAAVGSACNTVKDAQPLMAPLTLMLVVPMMFWFQIARDPNGALATALTFVPPMTPFIMMIRVTSQEATVPLWQQLVTPVWLGAWVLITMWAAARVFRVGLLMYGKPPGLRELARWVRY